MRYVVARDGLVFGPRYVAKPTALYHWTENKNEADTFTKREANKRAKAWKEWGARVEPAPKSDNEALVDALEDALDVKLAPVIAAYRATKRALEALPSNRMRALALTDLESSFSRACFAASDVTDPIEGKA